MIVAIDESPLVLGNAIQHKVRGSGFYLLELKKALLAKHGNNKFIFFTRREKLGPGVDVLHIPYFEPFFISLPIINAHKSVVTIHDLTPLVYPDLFPAGIKGKVKLAIQKILLRNFKAIITDSESSRDDISRILGINKQKIHVVYLAAASHFKKLDFSVDQMNNLREKYNLPKKFVLYVGDGTRNKNLPRLIQALEIAKIPIVMVGRALAHETHNNNPWNLDLKIVQEKARTNKTIHILGFVPDEDLVALYNSAALTVVVSLYEGFGLPILEAMQSGCPVVASKLGSIPEVADKAAYYVDALDAHDIANGIMNVYQDAIIRKSLSEKGLARAKLFSWDKTAQETVKVYEKVNNS